MDSKSILKRNSLYLQYDVAFSFYSELAFFMYLFEGIKSFISTVKIACITHKYLRCHNKFYIRWKNWRREEEEEEEEYIKRIEIPNWINTINYPWSIFFMATFNWLMTRKPNDALCLMLYRKYNFHHITM